MSGSGLKAQLQHDLHDAMRAQDKVRAGTLRMALTAVTTEEVAGEEARELDDAEVLKVLAKEAKKRREAADAYTGAGRPELAAAEEAELAVLEGYLPTQLGDEDLLAVVERAIAQSGATSLRDMGQVMRLAQAEAAGRAEGGRIATFVKELLAGR